MGEKKQQQYKLKTMLFTGGISYTQVEEEVGISRTRLAFLLNEQRWPADKAAVRKNIEAFLRRSGFTEEQIEECWRLEPRRHNGPGSADREVEKKIINNLVFRRKTMSPEILQKFGLARDPFDIELRDREDVLLTAQHRKVLDAMRLAARDQKFICVSGEVGSGKTILKTLLKMELIESGDYLVSEPMTTEKQRTRPGHLVSAMVMDFLYLLSPEQGNLNIDTLQSRTGRSIQLNMNREATSRVLFATLERKNTEGKRLVLILEEGHLFNNEALKSLKQFYEYQVGFRKMLGIIIIAQPEIDRRFKSDYSIREVAQRVQMIRLAPIPNRVKQYVEHRVARAGGVASRIFAESAYKQARALLQERANPLTIGNLLSSAVEKAWEVSADIVTSELVESAYNSLNGGMR